MSIKCRLGVIISFLLLNVINPMIALASEAAEETETNTKQNPIVSLVGLIVLVVVAYLVYHAMYDGTVIIGTKNGIASAIGRRLFIPVVAGAIAAGVVIKILQLFGSIIKILILIVLIGVVIKGLHLLYSKAKGKNIDISPVGDNENTIFTSESSHNQKIDTSVENNDSTNLMFCGGCGKKILRTVKFCPYCGKENNYSQS